MEGEVYLTLDALINMTSIKYPMQPKPNDLFCSGPDKHLMYPLSPSKNYCIAMATSQLHSKFILRSRSLLFHVSNCLLTMNISHSILIEWVGMARAVIM